MSFIQSGQVDPGPGYQGGQLGDDVQGRTNAAGAWMRRSGEIHWFEDDVCRAMVSRPRELPPQSLAEPCVNLSTHTAPIVRPFAYQALQ